MAEPVIDSRVKNASMVIKSVFNVCSFFGVAPWTVMRKMAPLAPADLRDGCQAVDLVIPKVPKSVWESVGVPTEDVKVRLYHPAASPASSPKKLPILIFFHGGAFVLGSACQKQVDDLLRKFIKDSPMVVISVDYRLAPEHKLPAAMDDALATVLWAHSASHPLIQEHGDPAKIILMGESSGGHLVACTTQYLSKHHPEVKVAHQVLLYPSMQLPKDQPTPSKTKFANGHIAWSEASETYRKASNPENHPDFVGSYLMQPLLGTGLEGLPPGQVIVGECDMFLDESRMYAEKLQQAGVPVTFRSYPNSVHGFFGMSFLPEAQQAYADTLAELKKANIF